MERGKRPPIGMGQGPGQWWREDSIGRGGRLPKGVGRGAGRESDVDKGVGRGLLGRLMWRAWQSVWARGLLGSLMWGAWLRVWAVGWLGHLRNEEQRQDYPIVTNNGSATRSSRTAAVLPDRHEKRQCYPIVTNNGSATGSSPTLLAAVRASSARAAFVSAAFTWACNS
jgi:hypothetical protein